MKTYQRDHYDGHHGVARAALYDGHIRLSVQVNGRPESDVLLLTHEQARELVDQLIAMLTPDAPAELTDAQRAHARLLAAEHASVFWPDGIPMEGGHTGQCLVWQLPVADRQVRDSITCPVCRKKMGLRPLDTKEAS